MALTLTPRVIDTAELDFPCVYMISRSGALSTRNYLHEIETTCENTMAYE